MSRTGGSAYVVRGGSANVVRGRLVIGESIWRPNYRGRRRKLERANEVAIERKDFTELHTKEALLIERHHQSDSQTTSTHACYVSRAVFISNKSQQYIHTGTCTCRL